MPPNTLANYNQLIGQDIGLTQEDQWDFGLTQSTSYPDANSLAYARYAMGAPVDMSNVNTSEVSPTTMGLIGLEVADRNQNRVMDLYEQQQNSWQNQYLSPILKGVQGLGSLANIYMGFKGLDLAKQQLGLAKEQWATTKDEINRIKRVRQKINKQYA